MVSNKDVEQLGNSEPCAFSPRNHPSIEARKNAITSPAPFAAHRPPCPCSWAPSLAECPSASLLCRSLWFVWCIRVDVTGANHRGFGPCASDFSISSLALALSPCYLAGLWYPASLGSTLDQPPMPPSHLPLSSPSPALNPWTWLALALDPWSPSCPHVPHPLSLPLAPPSLSIYTTATVLPPRPHAPDISPTTTVATHQLPTLAFGVFLSSNLFLSSPFPLPFLFSTVIFFNDSCSLSSPPPRFETRLFAQFRVTAAIILTIPPATTFSPFTSIIR